MALEGGVVARRGDEFRWWARGNRGRCRNPMTEMNPYQTPQAEDLPDARRGSGLRIIGGASMLRSFVIGIAGLVIFAFVDALLGNVWNPNSLIGGVAVYLLLSGGIRWYVERRLMSSPPEHAGRRALWAGPARIKGGFLSGLLFATGSELVYVSGHARTVLPIREIRQILEGRWWFGLKLEMADGEVVSFRMVRPRKWAQALGRLRQMGSG